MDPRHRGPDWMKISPVAGFLFHEKTQSRALQQVARCYEGDDQLELLAEGLFDGLRGKELEELLGVDTKGLAAIKRRLARRITAKFPDGGPV